MALFKLLFLLALLYFVARSVIRLAQAVLIDRTAAGRVQPPGRQERAPQWRGPVARKTRVPEGDVEDAKWVDLS